VFYRRTRGTCDARGQPNRSRTLGSCPGGR
jgi:hypothetical protein